MGRVFLDLSLGVFNWNQQVVSRSWSIRCRCLPPMSLGELRSSWILPASRHGTSGIFLHDISTPGLGSRIQPRLCRPCRKFFHLRAGAGHIFPRPESPTAAGRFARGRVLPIPLTRRAASHLSSSDSKLVNRKFGPSTSHDPMHQPFSSVSRCCSQNRLRCFRKCAHV